MGMENIMKELREIRKEIEYIKEHMIDADFILSVEEEKILEESMREFEEGKAIKLEDFKILKKLDEINYERIIKRLEGLSKDPFPPDAKRIIGRKAKFI